MTRSRVAAGIVVGFLITTPGQGGDLILPLNAHQSENGALVDGFKNGIQVNDRRFVEFHLGGLFNAWFPAIALENFVQAPDSNEIFAFSRGHPPTLIEDVPWTPFSDTIDVEFEDEYRITVYVWSVEEEGLTSALHGNVTTSAIWQAERQGVAFDSFEVIPAWEDPDAADFHDFNCGLSTEIKAQIGHNPDGLNIYYVDRVNFGAGLSPFAGIWCPSKIIAMGKSTSGHLLAHEVGHALGLGHSNQSNDAQYFDTTNVMHNASNEREFLTEGQTYRAVFRPNSVLNSIYDVREGKVTRSCPTSEFTFECPKSYRRVWADGPTWPTN